jgi:hypothetical protein
MKAAVKELLILKVNELKVTKHQEAEQKKEYGLMEWGNSPLCYIYETKIFHIEKCIAELFSLLEIKNIFKSSSHYMLNVLNEQDYKLIINYINSEYLKKAV